jgi:hypothetical protein
MQEKENCSWYCSRMPATNAASRRQKGIFLKKYKAVVFVMVTVRK